jgi:hypothetical protein
MKNKDTWVASLSAGMGVFLTTCVLAGCAGSTGNTARASAQGGLGVLPARDQDDETETIIALAELPAEVRAALAAITGEEHVTQVTRDEENGVTKYDVEYRHDGAPWAVEFAPDGSILEHEPDGDEEPDDDR